MKELTKIQVAAIKRTNQNVKPLMKKVISLNAKIEEMQAEAAILISQIDAFEAPIKLLTDGYTSTEYLLYLEKGVSPEAEGVEDTLEEVPPTTDLINNVDGVPFGNPTFPTAAL